MIKINCSECNKELEELGALLFSPPISKGELSILAKENLKGDLVVKIHLCKDCYDSTPYQTQGEESGR